MWQRKIEIVDREMAKILQSKTDAERLAITHGMWRFARGAIYNVLRAEHPEWDEDTLNREVAKRLSHGSV